MRYSQCPRLPSRSRPRQFGLRKRPYIRPVYDLNTQLLTALANLAALLGQLHVDDVSQTRLGVVGDRHSADLGLVIVHNRLVVFGVLLRC